MHKHLKKIFVIRATGNLTLKAPITTAAEDIHKYFFIVFPGK